MSHIHQLTDFGAAASAVSARSSSEQLQLPAGGSRPAHQPYCLDRVVLRLSASSTERLRRAGDQLDVGLFSMLTTGWAILLGRWSGQDDILLRASEHGRSEELDLAAHAAASTVALRIALPDDARVDQLLVQVKASFAGSVAGREAGSSLLLSDETKALSLSLIENAGGVAGELQFARELFDAATIERMASSWQTLLEEMATNASRPIGRLPLLNGIEQEQILRGFNATAMAYDQERLIHQLFEAQAGRTPDAAAIMDGEQILTYQQLNGRANQLARYLQERGVTADQPVAVYVERSLDMVVGLLGILKAGGAYVPLDPSYPTERLAHMLEDARPAVMLSQDKFATTRPPTHADVVTLDGHSQAIGQYAAEDLRAGKPALAPSNLVYVIYTSGSTGRPKGTAMSHGAMVNLIEWHRRQLPLVPEERVLQFAALSFDVAFQEIFSTLCLGGTLVLPKEWVRRDPLALAELLSSRSVRRLFLPPLMLQSLAEAVTRAGAPLPEQLRDVITAGEQLRVSPEIVALFRALRGCRLHNHYGPTESHVVTAFTLAGDPGRWPTLPSIGGPIANTSIYVLDRALQVVPIGVVGEIYIGGRGVARGYLNAPSLTTQRFIADPFEVTGGGRMYRTGDLARWHPDGTLEHLGRNDYQVKIRGFRIELAEIEAQLVRHPEVKEAVVVAREDAPGHKRLVAYLTKRDERPPNVEQLGAELRTSLPEHMVPSAFVLLESLPLSPNGKLDRRALPPPRGEAAQGEPFEAPQGEVETLLSGIWQEVLQVARVGRRDHFFERGGDSLAAMRLASRIAERFMIRFHAHTVFRQPTFFKLAETITGLR